MQQSSHSRGPELSRSKKVATRHAQLFGNKKSRKGSSFIARGQVPRTLRGIAEFDF
jgi:hypothetical protein